jgi:hypothetical protein
MTQKAQETIYVALLNEGTSVWRPVAAIPVGDGMYQIVSENDDPEDEQWEFSTGDVVLCVSRTFGNGSGLVAVRRINRVL